ncbi:MAG: hypothetical protein J1G04_01680 [Clostridiales bacterium]|nr:hypothetical protein [Clostridiales bacterium]
MAKVENPTVLFGKSKFIWSAHGAEHVIMRRAFSFGVDKPPARALCRAACDTHYCLYVNGNAAVWFGGMNRGKHSYYDEFDIAKYLVKGDNVLVVHCLYYGADGRDLVTSGKPAFIFECNDIKVYSDETFFVYENPAFKRPAPGNCCYAGASLDYDAAFEGQIQNLLDPAFKSSLFVPATVLDNYPSTALGTILERPLPLERFSRAPVTAKSKKSTDQFNGDLYTIDLPKYMRVTPYFEVIGEGQETIVIKTDCTDCQGCFGDEKSVYHGHSVKYTTKPTVNIFDCMLPMTGEKLYFSMPRSVKVLKLGYREIGYDTVPTCEFSTGNAMYDRLFDKAMNTLYACMDSTIMDTPERERTMWMGDSSIAARAMYIGYAGAAPLVKKVIKDILENADGCVLRSCVPGNVPVDIPAHGLFALSEYGLFAQYRNFTKDIELFKSEYEKLCNYLMLWEMTEHGVALRDGNRRWYDNLYNIDEALVENALYYSACKFMLALGEKVGNHDYDEDFTDRMDNIAEYIESSWDGLGYSSREDGYDDRANALIVLSGLVPNNRYDALARLLGSTMEASPYMEWAAIEALTVLGRRDLALRRFTSRYALASAEDSTVLGEDFGGYGAKCQVDQSAVISELVLMLGGITVKNGASEILITPDFTAFKDFKCSFTLESGELDLRYKYSPTRIDIIIDNETSAKITLDITPERIGRAVERRTILLNKGKNKFSL